MNILFIDLETTGTEPDRHGILEIAAELYVDGQKVNSFNERFYDKQSPVSVEALKINGVRVNELPSMGHEYIAVANFVDWLLGLKVKGTLHVGGHNVHFDVSFIKALMKKYQIEKLETVMGYKYIDTFALAAALMEAGKLNPPGGKTNLKSVAEALNIDTTQYKLHTAKDDVALTAHVYYSMVRLIRGD